MFHLLVVQIALFVLPQGVGQNQDRIQRRAQLVGHSYHALKQRANIQPGETLLVLGASGGVGLAAVELGKAMGAKVIAAASSDDKLQEPRKPAPTT